MLLKIMGSVALFGVIFAPLAVIFTATSLVELMLYTLCIELILAALFIIFTDDFSLLGERRRRLREFERKYL